jgi:hypothetical protein
MEGRMTTVEAAVSHRKTTSSGMMVATEVNGTKLLHVVSEKAGGGFDYYRLNRDSGTWAGPYASRGSALNAHNPIVMAGSDNRLDAFYREVQFTLEKPVSATFDGELKQIVSKPFTDAIDYPWSVAETPWTVAKSAGVIGAPALCQWSNPRGFDFIAPLAQGGLRHWWREPIDAKWTHERDLLGGTKFSGCAIALGDGKRLYVIAVDVALNYWHINRDQNENWNSINHGPAYAGALALVESGRSGAPFDIVVANANGGLIHYQANAIFEVLPSTRLNFGNLNGLYRQVGLVAISEKELHCVALTAGGSLEHWTFNGSGWSAGKAMPPQPDPKTAGSWNVQYDAAVIGIHAALLHTGEVLLCGMADETADEARGAVLDPASEIATPLGKIPHVFCSGHAFTEAGDLLVAGGHGVAWKFIYHEHKAHLFKRNKDNTGWEFEALPDLNHGRWYPTCTTLPDGGILIISGAYKAGGGAINNTYEIFDPKKPQDKRPVYDIGTEIGGDFGPGCGPVDMYPFVYVVPGGRLFVHSAYTTRFLKIAKKAGTWTKGYDANMKWSRTYPYQGTSVLLPLELDFKGDLKSATVAIIGGSGKNANIDTLASSSIETMNVMDKDPLWTEEKDMPRPRVMPDAVLLPDGNVLIVSGSHQGRGDGPNGSRNPELEVDLWDPKKKAFTTMARMRTPRLYHATAILLPDARVLVTGKCKVYNTCPYDYPEHRGEVFTPPYLHAGTRPEIDKVPAVIDKGGEKFTITLLKTKAADIRSVVLVRPSAATHSFNMEQRVVSLYFEPSGETLQALAPLNNTVVPPGYYMLFVVSKSGVPSHAKFVKVAVWNDTLSS